MNEAFRQTNLGHDALPYDSEVEYLESTGEQYIDTLVPISPGHRVVIDFALTQTPTYLPGSRERGIFGGYVTNFDGQFKPVSISASPSHILLRLGSFSIPQTVDTYRRIAFFGKTERRGNYTMGIPSVYSVLGSMPSMVYSSGSDRTFAIFASKNTNESNDYVYCPSSMKLYSAAIYNNGILEHHYIPVRRGSVGFLYDKITKTAFYNCGQGEFKFGSDIKGYDVILPNSISITDDGLIILGSGSPFVYNITFAELHCIGSLIYHLPSSQPLFIHGMGANQGDSISIYYTVNDGAQVQRNVSQSSSLSLTCQPGDTVVITALQGTVAASSGDDGGGCLVEGTLVRLADGTTKRIEEITYSDNLLVWDGKGFTSAKPRWIMKPYRAGHWFLCKFASGRILGTTGARLDPGHRVYSLETNCFEYEKDAIGHRVRTVRFQDASAKDMKPDEDVLTSVECIPHSCMAYNIITEGHYNLFAGDALTSCRLSNSGMTDGERAAYWERIGRIKKSDG